MRQWLGCHRQYAARQQHNWNDILWVNFLSNDLCWRWKQTLRTNRRPDPTKEGCPWSVDVAKPAECTPATNGLAAYVTCLAIAGPATIGRTLCGREIHTWKSLDFITLNLNKIFTRSRFVGRWEKSSQLVHVILMRRLVREKERQRLVR